MEGIHGTDDERRAGNELREKTPHAAKDSTVVDEG